MAEIKNIMGDSMSKVQESIQTSKKKLETSKEINRLKKEMRLLLNEKGLALTKIGMQAHHLFRLRKFKDDLIHEISENIKNLDKEIFNLQKQVVDLAKSDEILVCGKCGQQASLEDKFCAGCGALIEKPVQQKPSGECSCCGSPIEESYKFCIACGQSLLDRGV